MNNNKNGWQNERGDQRDNLQESNVLSVRGGHNGRLKQSCLFFLDIGTSRLGPFLSFTRPENEINQSSEKIEGTTDVENVSPFLCCSLYEEIKVSVTI